MSRPRRRVSPRGSPLRSRRASIRVGSPFSTGRTRSLRSCSRPSPTPGIAATVLGGRRFFEIPEVRQAVMALRGASVAPMESGFLDTVRDVLRSLGLTNDPPQAGGALRDAWEARSAILRLAHEAPDGATLRTFTDDLVARAKAQDEPGLRTVTLATLHAAKGLEWDHVHLSGWPKASCRSPTRRPSRRSTRSGASPTWGSRGLRERCRCRGPADLGVGCRPGSSERSAAARCVRPMRPRRLPAGPDVQGHRAHRLTLRPTLRVAEHPGRGQARLPHRGETDRGAVRPSS